MNLSNYFGENIYLIDLETEKVQTLRQNWQDLHYLEFRNRDYFENGQSKTGYFLLGGRSGRITGVLNVETETETDISNSVPEIYEKPFTSKLGLTLIELNGQSIMLRVKEGKIHVGNSAGAEVDLVSFGNKDAAIVTPEGLFDGTPNAWKQLIWRFDNNTFSHAPVEAFFNEFYRPGLLQEILQGKTPEPPKTDLASVDIRQPDVNITTVDGRKIETGSFGKTAQLTAAPTKRQAEVAVEVTDNNKEKRGPGHMATSGARDLRLFRGGSLVKKWTGDLFEKDSGCEAVPVKTGEPRKAICKTTVALTAGDNPLSAYAFNTQNVKSTDTEAVVKGAESPKSKGKMHILAIGVNEYTTPSHNLRYAVADAVEFGKELREKQAALKNFDTPEVVELKNSEATKRNILYALERYAKGDAAARPAGLEGDLDRKLSAIAKAQPEDVFVFYFAGHGTAAKDRFYLIPHDGFPTDTIDENERLRRLYAASISDEELENALENLDAGQLLMVIDACNSGQALEAEEKRRGPMNSRGLAQLAYEKGMYILTAAQPYESALEVTRTASGKAIEHGLLTYSLLEGLTTNKADKDANKEVLDREWLSYAVEAVPKIQAEEMRVRNVDFKRRDSGSEASRDYVIFVYADNPDSDIRMRTLQTPRVFYRRESPQHPLVVAKN